MNNVPHSGPHALRAGFSNLPLVANFIPVLSLLGKGLEVQVHHLISLGGWKYVTSVCLIALASAIKYN